ncbi:MAG: methyltransferase domain-containing protein [Gemmataceae bacterium]|nr:methyltransferase domain-containing protein [Gemmataceae bacterium]
MGWGLPGILRFLPKPTLVPVQQIQRTLVMLSPEARILDVGAGGRRITPGIVTFDAFPGPEVDIVGDIHQLPIDDNSFDCVFCTGTLEHVADPFQAVHEIHRVIKPGGIVHIDVPFIQGYHADPTDYWRFTLDGLKLLAKEFEELDAGVYIGPSCGLTWIAREWADSCCSNRVISNLLLVATALVMAPLKYLDYLLIHSKRSHRVASAVFFRGRKLARPQTSPVSESLCERPC